MALYLPHDGVDTATWILSNPPDESVPQVWLNGVWVTPTVVDAYTITVNVCGPDVSPVPDGYVVIHQTQHPRVEIAGVIRPQKPDEGSPIVITY